MEFSSPSSVSRGVRVLRRRNLKAQHRIHKHGLSFYNEYPSQIVILDDLLKFAEERLAVKYTKKLLPSLLHMFDLLPLEPSHEYMTRQASSVHQPLVRFLRTIERINLGKTAKFSEAWRDQLLQELRKQNLKIYANVLGGSKDALDDEVQKARERDILSHFALRLGYSSTEENRRWFVQHETDLFRCRFIEESSSLVKEFVKDEKMKFQVVSEEEKTEYSEELSSCTFSMTAPKVATSEFFKVPFIEALDLIKNRRVFLRKGFALVPFEDFGTIIAALFRAQISQAMVVTARGRSILDSDQRLHRLLNDFDKRSTGQEGVSFAADGNLKITYQMLDTLSKQSFPLCARSLHEAVRHDHHLKHGGRMQHGLFLKGIGLPLEDSMKFWREEFTKAMDVDKFEKNYAYNIRHNYGKEGNKVNYTPYSCSKIINGSVGPGDHHGCPFRHFDAKELKNRLQNYKTSAPVIEDILQLVSGKHYQIACQRYFEATHNVLLQGGIQHPNQYFLESQKVLNGDARPNVERVKVDTVREVSYSQDVLRPSQATQASDIQSVASQLTEGIDFDEEFDSEISAMDDSLLSIQ